MATHDTIYYEFKELGLTATIKVSVPADEYEASNNIKYPGYAIVSGTVQYEDRGNKRTVQVAPQTINPYDVLWATSGSGNGGSESGIDSNGIALQGDNGNLAWMRKKGEFWLQEGSVNQQVTLDSVRNWPPAS